MNTDDLILYTDSARHSIDDLEALINTSFEATPRAPVDQFLGMHVTRDKDKGLLSIDARRHVYDFVRGMGTFLHRRENPLSLQSASGKRLLHLLVLVEPLRDRLLAHR